MCGALSGRTHLKADLDCLLAPVYKSCPLCAASTLLRLKIDFLLLAAFIQCLQCDVHLRFAPEPDRNVRLQVREASVKFAKAIGGATSGAVPMLGVFQEAVVQVVQGFPDMSEYRPFGRWVPHANFEQSLVMLKSCKSPSPTHAAAGMHVASSAWSALHLVLLSLFAQKAIV